LATFSEDPVIIWNHAVLHNEKEIYSTGSGIEFFENHLILYKIGDVIFANQKNI